MQPKAFEAWVDRESETRALAEAIRERRSLLIWGPAGVGKTRLVAKVLDELPPEVAQGCLYVSGTKSPQELARELTAKLFQAGDAIVRLKFQKNRASKAVAFGSWLNQQSSLRLKGILYGALPQREYRIFLDHLPPLTHAVAKVIRRFVWMCKTPVYLLARGVREREIGHITDLYWLGDNRLALGPLSREDARELLETCIRAFGLSQMDLHGFREEILCLSRQLPGAIVNMCALAVDPRYQFGRQIKTKLLHIDFLMGGAELNAAHKTAARRFEL